MELTLLPITALLLLLSGAVAPTRLGGEGVGTAALLCWLGAETVPLAESRASASEVRISMMWRTGPRVPAHQNLYALPQETRNRLRALSRKLLRTRFGVYSAAYQAVAPPLA